MTSSPTSEPQEPLSRLRWLLAQRPSPIGFSQLLDVFAGWDDPEAVALGMAYAETHLQDWDDASRTARPERCWPMYPEGAAPPQMQLMRTWDMSGKNGLDDLQPLLETPYAQHLTALYAPRCKLDRDAIWALAESPNLCNLRALDLSENDLTDLEIEFLMDSPHLTNLRVLRLQENHITSQGAYHIAHATTMAHLQVLNLSCNAIGTSGVKAITESSYLTRLTALYLAENQNWTHYYYDDALGDKAAMLLAKAPHMRQLEILDLSDNGLTTTGKKALAESKTLPASIRYPYIKELEKALR